VAREGVVDAAGEGLDDRLLDPLEPVLEEECCERGLEQGGEDVAVVRQALELLGGDVCAPREELLAQLELARDDCAARPRDDVGADLRQSAFGEVRVPLVQLACDRELEDAVAQELQPLV
jgi:hypothetical protein